MVGGGGRTVRKRVEGSMKFKMLFKLLYDANLSEIIADSLFKGFNFSQWLCRADSPLLQYS
jgi:hypothetical protein